MENRFNKIDYKLYQIKELNIIEVNILAYIISYDNNVKNIFVSNEELSNVFNVSLSSVQRSINKLTSIGIIEKAKGFNRRFIIINHNKLNNLLNSNSNEVLKENNTNVSIEVKNTLKNDLNEFDENIKYNKFINELDSMIDVSNPIINNKKNKTPIDNTINPFPKESEQHIKYFELIEKGYSPKAAHHILNF
jgi:predicted transcriptional regulator